MSSVPHHHEWQLQEAKNKLSHVINLAMKDEPQIITLRGKKAAVVLSIDSYMQLIRSTSTLSEFFRQSPLKNIENDFTRDEDTGRDTEL